MSDVKNRFNPDWLTGVFTTIIAFISVAALIYAHLQLKEAHEESQVQHLLSLQQQYEQEPMVTYRKLYATKRRVSTTLRQVFAKFSEFSCVGGGPQKISRQEGLGTTLANP